MIEVKSLVVQYGTQPVLNNISSCFEEGMVHGIAGLNGAGKTTFFNTLAGIAKPSAGNILYKNAALTYKAVSFLETVNYFYTGITGNEYLKIFRLTNPGFDLTVLQEYFKLPLDSLVQQYSTGMKKKLAVLALLKQDTPVYLLDEPFNGLDMETNKVMEVIINTLQQKGKTIFISSHILEPLITVCHRIHLLEEGRFVKIFDKADFDNIEATLFGQLKARATTEIAGAI